MIPDRKGERWYEKKAVIEALATVPPILAAAIGALVSLSDRQQRAFGWWLLAGAVWLIVASAAKVLHARAQDRERKRSDSHDGLRAALHVLFATVCQAAGIEEGNERTSGRLRLTIHRVVAKGKGDSPEELEQVLPYMGGPGNPPGRRFSIRSGIIGAAARRKSAIVAVRGCAEYDGFVAEIIRDWAYTESDARRLTPDRQAWMAVPILNAEGAPVAVVYLDSREPNFFTDPLQGLIFAICGGINTYTLETYR
jgi:putative methionine-R-sulfoxide reductase with GAF domain